MAVRPNFVILPTSFRLKAALWLENFFLCPCLRYWIVVPCCHCVTHFLPPPRLAHQSGIMIIFIRDNQRSAKLKTLQQFFFYVPIELGFHPIDAEWWKWVNPFIVIACMLLSSAVKVSKLSTSQLLGYSWTNVEMLHGARGVGGGMWCNLG